MCAEVESDGVSVTNRLRLDLAYDGTDFSGWASQTDRRTVQGTLESALDQVIAPNAMGKHFAVTCAGRTDAGVHATQQSVHFDISATEYESLVRHTTLTPEQALLRRLRGVLPADVNVYSATLAPNDFHARFSALSRTYTYKLIDDQHFMHPIFRRDTFFTRNKLDLRAIQQATKPLLGEHDFSAFARVRKDQSPIRTLHKFDWVKKPLDLPAFTAEKPYFIEVTIQANAFLHNMVRSLISASLFVGEHRMPAEWLYSKLQSREREGKTGPVDACGLTLSAVEY
ncbi:MAG: tRNA pseudouridine(38-40) synthase TruA [Bifidobacteriaceae bacterium]|jgi:tRNA pseudouridine38-40 synthase|nr:tRNA pseudouridine(38-40) synthase TruA [Bifidobacteriaceae bacterium]